MRKKAFQCILSFLALLGTVDASISPNAECTVQAWVRAPDLVPDSIVGGDTRVKISAGCPAVETVSLGLRLKERSIVKALRSQEDRKWMSSMNQHRQNVDWQRISPWDIPWHGRSCQSDEATETLNNKDLWVVREEERLVFETTQVIHMAKGAFRDHDVVQDFAVLVPSTNFPPALDYTNSMFVLGSNIELSDVEFMYEYFIRVPFANGTTEEILAGLTSFQPLYDPTDTLRGPSSEAIALEPTHLGATLKDSPINYTAQVSDLVFTEGSENQVVTVVITRTGPARTFTAPLTIQACVQTTHSSKWAVEYGMRGSGLLRSPGYVLRSTPEDVQAREKMRHRWIPSCRGRSDGTGVSVTMPNSTSDEIQSGDVVTTTSAAVSIAVAVDRLQVANFETYYQTLANSLRITLETPRSEDESVNPDDPSAEVPSTWGPEPKFGDDEEPWVPWEKKPESERPRRKSWGTYSGSVPVVVRPMSAGKVMPSQRCLHAVDMTSGQVILSNCEQHSLIHYLDEGARGPIFVDPSVIHEFLAEDPSQRALRAPILEPVVSSPPEGEELVYRYHRHPRKPLIYVGETWVKKVVNKDQHKVSAAMSSSGPGPITLEYVKLD
ncbi:hypothetical protein OG21DRAFT_287686 [Imleria badia]|nr:hypothetical protein OG21DRAFT_287686 [Imleria badia]